MWLKICGIQTEKNGILLAERGVDALGLNRYPDSSRFLSDTKARAISFSVHRTNPNVDRVGIYVNEPVDSIKNDIDNFDLDVVQLHGDEPPEQVRELSASSRVIKAFAVGPDFDETVFTRYNPWAFLLDAHVPGKYGGTGTTAPWKRIRAWAQDHKIILAGGLNPDNFQTAARTAKPWGLDFNSELETEEGRKDPVKLRRLLKQYEAMENETSTE